MDDGIHNRMNYRLLKEKFLFATTNKKMKYPASFRQYHRISILSLSLQAILQYPTVVTVLLLMKMVCKLLKLNFDCNSQKKKIIFVRNAINDEQYLDSSLLFYSIKLDAPCL